MVIVNRGQRKDILDKVFFYKAIDEHVSRIGCNQFINYHENNFDKNYKNKTKKFDAIKVLSQKKK
jgi:hypothetical protein